LIAAFYLLTRRAEPKSLTALKIFVVESIKETMNDECGTMNCERQNSGVRSQEPEYKAETSLKDSLLFYSGS
jgi:hypothetical protein